MGRFRNSTRERSTRPVQIEYTDAASADEATRYNDTDETSKTEGEKKKNTKWSSRENIKNQDKEVEAKYK